MDHTPISSEETPASALVKHEFAVYNLRLRPRGSSTGRDLIQMLRDGNTYLVDNNVSWKHLAIKYIDVNFVIGCTAAEEAENLQGMLFNKKNPAGGYANVFIAEIYANSRQCVTFNKLDAHYQKAVFRSPIPTLQESPSEHREYQRRAAESLRIQVNENLPRAIEDLRAELDARLPLSRSNFVEAGMAAVIATTLYLKGKALVQQASYLDPSYTHFPGDTRLIAEALYYGFGVISKDEKDVHTLSRLVGVRTLTEDEFSARMDTGHGKAGHV